jgi:ataxia telangiectasia mutated family protein
LLCNAFTELADVELPSDTKTNVNIPFDSRWSIGRINGNISSADALAIPTKAIQVDPSGQYSAITTVSGFGNGFRVVGGINLPKIIDCVGSDGQVYRQLVKGKDDVRQVISELSCLYLNICRML